MYFRRGEWRSAASTAVLPALIIASALFPRALLTPLLSVGDYLRFWVNRSSYLAEVATVPRRCQRGCAQDRGPRLVRFPLGGFFLNPQEIVYDESDEIALPPEQQSDGWLHRAGGEYGVCHYGLLHLEGHFYKVSFSC